LQAVDVVESRAVRGSRFLDRTRLVWAGLAVAGAAVFCLSWVALQQTSGPRQLRDTPLYEAYADAIRAGDLPYRDFLLEYPPGALAAFLAPELTTAPEHFGGYSKVFERWMAACGIAMMGAIAAALAALGVRPRRASVVLALAALSPLFLGSVILSRFDLWPAALTVAAVATLLTGHWRWSAILFGVAIATKIYPVVCVPIGFVWVWRQYGRRAAIVWSGLLATLVAAVFAPFAVLAPDGIAHSFSFQLGRPLQIESLGAALLVTAHWLGGLPLVLHSDHGSTNIVGALPNLLGNISTACQIVLLVGIWMLFARGPASRQRFVIAVAAAVSTFVAFGKVFSPQYMIWLIPLVPLVGGRRGIAAGALLALSLMLTHAWFPQGYGDYVYRLGITQSVEVLVRDLAVAASAILLTRWLATDNAAPG
jgi:hypothetical protein